MSLLFSEGTIGPLRLQNRLVMAPMTRSRATHNIPNDLMAKYYSQRSSAGLIVTEGTAPSPDALGYARIPGIFSPEQVEGWKPITEAVHQGGGHIFVQLMHTGRMTHPLNLPPGGRVLAPSAIAANEQMFTDSEGLQDLPVPTEMTGDDIEAVISGFVQAAQNALIAGFDGVELHGANGYLLEQFMRPNSNHRADAYGGPVENRIRLLLEVVSAVSSSIGKDHVGIRLSPYGVVNDVPLYESIESDYAYLAKKLNDTDALTYIHLVDHSTMGTPEVPASIKSTFRQRFNRTLILSGGYDDVSAERDLAAGRADLIAVARPFIANPDLVARWQQGAALDKHDDETLYTPGEAGYTDYRPMGC